MNGRISFQGSLLLLRVAIWFTYFIGFKSANDNHDVYILPLGLSFKFTYYCFRKFFLIPPIIPEIILREIALFTIIQIITLSKYKRLLAAKDFLKRCHRYEKYLIVGSSFYKCECIMAWETKTTALILNRKDYISDFKVSFSCTFKLEMLVYLLFRNLFSILFSSDYSQNYSGIICRHMPICHENQ